MRCFRDACGTVRGLGRAAVLLALAFLPPAAVAYVSDYDQLEYLQGDGTAYIDLATRLTQDDAVELTAMACTAHAAGVFGSRTSSDASDCFIFAFNVTGSFDDCVVDFSDTYAAHRIILHPKAQGLLKTKMHVINNKTRRAVYDADTGVLVAENTATVTANFTSPYDILLFGTSGTIWTTAKFQGRIYAFSIVRDGVTRMNLLPARRSADGVLGMYDTVSGTFFTNAAGSGAFTAGPAAGVTFSVTVGGPYGWTGAAITPAPVVRDAFGFAVDATGYEVAYSNNVNPGLAIVTVTGKGAYAEYAAATAAFRITGSRAHLATFGRPCEYVQGDGKAYIDLATKLTQDDAVELTAMACTPHAAGVFGSRTGSDIKDAFLFGFNVSGDYDDCMVDFCDITTGRLLLHPAAAGLIAPKLHIVDNANLRAICDADSGALVAEDATTVTTTFTTPYDIQLFGASGDIWTTGKFKGRVYDFRIVRDGAVRMDLLPAKRTSDGAVGMYDLFSGAFFTNAAGSGAFTAGRSAGGGMSVLIR